MKLHKKASLPKVSTITLPGSKSISHRALIAADLSGMPIESIKGLSGCDDTQFLLRAIQNQQQEKHDFGDGATPLHFFMVLAAAKNKPLVLTGSERLMQRPHGDLINLLSQCDSVIKQTPQEIIIDKGIQSFQSITADATRSSQHISAMMLVAPLFPGLKEIVITDKPASFPYIKLTADLMRIFGVDTFISEENILIETGSYQPPETLQIEPDWSAAAFFYSLVSCAPGMSILLKGLRLNSMQGDSALANFYYELGVSSTQTEDGILISHSGKFNPNPVVNLINYPDCAPTIMATCAYLRINASFTGLENLVLKESNRLEAMAVNLKQTGANISLRNGAYFLSYDENILANTPLDIKTHGDHRIAMAIAIFGLKHTVNIDNPECVSKSFPGFWQQWSHWFHSDR